MSFSLLQALRDLPFAFVDVETTGASADFGHRVIEIGKQRAAYLAHKATNAEREQLWPRLVELYADFASYQAWTEREIPVVICEPTG